MSVGLVSLCSVPPIATRDGDVGGSAHMYLPFYGHWYASGQIYSYNGTLNQDKSRLLSGTKMLSNYKKDCCCCS